MKKDKRPAQDEENYEEEEEEEQGNADQAANGRAEMWAVGKEGQLDLDPFEHWTQCVGLFWWIRNMFLNWSALVKRRCTKAALTTNRPDALLSVYAICSI